MAPSNIAPPGHRPAVRAAPRPRAVIVDANVETPLLGRRDVALIPWIVICVGSFALALSQALRPAHGGLGEFANLVTVGGAIVFGVTAGGLAAVQDSTWGMRLRGALWVYLLGSFALLVGLMALGLLDHGLATVSFTATVLMAAYLGLVFPPVWGRASFGVLLVAMAVVQVLKPDADALEAISIVALAAAAWAVGTVLRHANQEATDQALLLSRSDQLTGILNRRGFLDQLDDELRRAAKARRPLALLVIDLNGFKLINDTEGHAAGDQLLAWVGATVPVHLPSDAAFGRLGGDEFAVALPAATALAANITAERIREALAERVGASIGVASNPEGRMVDGYSLLQTADTALYAAKQDPAKRVQVLEAELVDVEAAHRARGSKSGAALTFAQLQLAGGAPKAFFSTLYRGTTIAVSFGIVAAAGAVFVASTILSGGNSFYELVIKLSGIPWVLATIALALYFRPRRYNNDEPPMLLFYSSVVLVGGGIASGALSTGMGAMAPITAGLFLKVLYDSAMAPRGVALQCFAAILVCWLVLLVLGPADALWVAPYQFALLIGGFLFGTIGRRAFKDAVDIRLRLANLDGLTGLLNRRGFEHRAEAVLQQAEQAHATFAVITFDLDDFKGVNDRLGHAAGDELLCAVAAVTTESLTQAQAIGRLGGDEFVATIPTESLADAMVSADRLDMALQTVTGGSVGCAVFPDDGTDLDELLLVADHRAYAVKKARAAANG